jgi:hypothetical protein
MSIFSKVAMPRPPSNTFDLSHSRKFSGFIGEIMPINVMECVPGDKFSIKSTNLTRFAPLITPIMHKASVYCHYFFVPNRILWNNWETFIAGSVDGQYPNSDAASPAFSEPPFPKLDITTSAEKETSSLADYLGLPTTELTPGGGVPDITNVSALPFAAYQKIYNDYYRDENLITPDEVVLANGTQSAADTLKLCKKQKRAWQHDYFTSALPWTQKGPEATLPLGTTAPLTYVGGGETFLKTDTGSNVNNFDSSGTPIETSAGGFMNIANPGTTYVNWDNSAVMEANLSGATAASINELRRAFRLQEWLERNARGGTRYIEIIMAHFGVTSSDARLQRPEFLGGSSTPITISEVLQTSDNSGGADGGPQGNMAGHGVSVGSSDYVNYKCEEHGYIIGVMTVMPMTAYQQGIPKHWSKFDKFDFYWPSFANIGEQAITNQELYYQNTGADDTTFGYTPRYAEYKYIPSTVHGTFKTSLNFWHMGRIFSSAPSLNQDFIECDSTEVSRVFAVEDNTVEHLYVYLHNEVKATRLMPYFGTPTI